MCILFRVLILYTWETQDGGKLSIVFKLLTRFRAQIECYARPEIPLSLEWNAINNFATTLHQIFSLLHTKGDFSTRGNTGKNRQVLHQSRSSTLPNE